MKVVILATIILLTAACSNNSTKLAGTCNVSEGYSSILRPASNSEILHETTYCFKKISDYRKSLALSNLERTIKYVNEKNFTKALVIHETLYQVEVYHSRISELDNLLKRDLDRVYKAYN